MSVPKHIACCFLVMCMACGTDLEITTDENYEAVVLPDGSQVYLNHNSAISYDKDFTPRQIYLIGEAFFKVVPGESVFTITTEHGTVKVLGTEFNLKTASEQLVVDVKKGVVELKTAYGTSKVKKGIKAIYKDGATTVQQLKSDKVYRKWIRSLNQELKKLDKELKLILREVGDEFEKVGRKIGKEIKK